MPCWIGYRQKQHLPFALLDWIHTKATPTLERLLFAHAGLIQTTGTLTICPAGLDTHQNKRPEPQPLERLPFAPLDWIHTKANAHTGTLTICPVGLDTHQSNAHTGTLTICTRWIDTDNWNTHTGTPTICTRWIDTDNWNTHTGTPTICTRWIDTDNWNAYYLHPLDWIQTKATPTLERLPFAPAGLDTDQSKHPHWNTYHLPRWIGYRPKQRPHWNAYYLHLLNWIQTKATPTLERLLFAPAGISKSPNN